jgi:hypothetical protein
MKTTTTLLAALATAFLTTTFAPAPRAGEPAAGSRFTIADPQGDDHGDGTMTYPLRDDLRPGDLDLVSLSAKPVRGGTSFEAVFARPIRGTAGRAIDIGGGVLSQVARHGFYTLNLDIYVDTDRAPDSGSFNALPGRNAEIARANAWEKAIVLTPRPNETKQALKRLMLREIKRDRKAEGERLAQTQLDTLRAEIANDVEARVFFPTRISVAGRKISFFVPDAFLGGAARDTWAYAVAVSGADIEQKLDIQTSIGIAGFRGDAMMILPIFLSASQEAFGGGREGELEFQPALVDIVVPKGLEQEKVLQGYDLKTGARVKLPAVVPAEAGR